MIRPSGQRHAGGSRGAGSGRRHPLIGRLTAVAVILVLVASIPACGGRGDDQPPARPEDRRGDGQRLLGEAVGAKLRLDGGPDFDKSLRLCREALDSHLGPTEKAFAEEFHTGILIERGTMVAVGVLGARQRDDEWQRMRGMAVRDLEEAVARDDRLGDIHLMLARLDSLPGGDRSRAAAAAKRALELADGNVALARDAHLVAAELEADSEVREGHYDAAVELLPFDVEARRARGLYLMTAGEDEAACVDLRVAMGGRPRDPVILEAMGVACGRRGLWEEACGWFSEAVEMGPTSVGLLLRRAEARGHRGDAAGALADIGLAASLAPESANVRLARAKLLRSQGKLADALADVNAALQTERTMPEAIEMKGRIAADRGDYVEAIWAFRNLVATRPDDPELISELARLYLAGRKPREAAKRFSRALVIDPDCPAALAGRGEALAAVGDHVAARDDLERASTLRPDDPAALAALAWLLATSPEDAVRDGQRALDLASRACDSAAADDVRCRRALAAAHAEVGQYARAEEIVRGLLTAGRGIPVAAPPLELDLARYRSRQPYRERLQTPEADD